MANSPTLSSLEKLKSQRAKLDARIQAAEARSKNAERKQETRRKILVGSYYLDKARNEDKLGEIKKIMDGYLSRDSDRKLFELPVSNTEDKKNPA